MLRPLSYKIRMIFVTGSLMIAPAVPQVAHAFDPWRSTPRPESAQFAQSDRGNAERGNGARGQGNAPFVTPLVPRSSSEWRPRGQDRARDAVRKGEIRPLEEVMARVQQRYPGRLLDVNLDQSQPRWVYYLKMLTRNGQVRRVAVDARTGQILSAR